MTNNKTATRYYSSKQEKNIAKEIGCKKVANSGATKFNKGDVVSSQWLIEAKTCLEHKNSFSIKEEWLKKNREEAVAMRKPYSALAFQFGPDEPNYYVIPERLFKILKEYLEQEE